MHFDGSQSIARWQNSDMAERSKGYALRIDIGAEPERIWRALTDRAHLMKWCSPSARVSPKSGGSLSGSRGDIAVREFVREVEAQIKAVPLRGTRVDSFASGRPEMRQTLDRAEKFLNLVALLSAMD